MTNQTIPSKLNSQFLSEDESASSHINDHLSGENDIKTSALNINSTKTHLRTFSRQAHSVPPQSLFNETLDRPSTSKTSSKMCHSLSLQNGCPLSPISSCGGSAIEDEDETLYALNAHNGNNEDLSYSQMSALPRDENECLMSEEETEDIYDLSYREDYSTTTNSEMVLLPSRFELMTQRNSNGKTCPSIPPKSAKLNIHIATPMPSISLSTPIKKCQDFNNVFFQIPVIVLQNILTRLSYKEVY